MGTHNCRAQHKNQSITYKNQFSSVTFTPETDIWAICMWLCYLFTWRLPHVHRNSIHIPFHSLGLYSIFNPVANEIWQDICSLSYTCNFRWRLSCQNFHMRTYQTWQWSAKMLKKVEYWRNCIQQAFRLQCQVGLFKKTKAFTPSPSYTFVLWLHKCCRVLCMMHSTLGTIFTHIQKSLVEWLAMQMNRFLAAKSFPYPITVS